jgi:hypothetical protein
MYISSNILCLLLALQIKNGKIQVMPLVGVPERPIVGDGVNFPARWQPRIPDSGSMSTIPLPGAQ